MTARKVVTRSGGHSRGYMPSIKNQCVAAWESSWELKFYQLLELSPSVRRFHVQPTREQILVNEVATDYIPDVHVFFVDGSDAFFEVKPALKCSTKRIATRLNAIRKHFEATNRRFQLVTDAWLERGTRAQNVNRLMFHRRDQILSATERAGAARIIAVNQPKDISELCGVVGNDTCWLLLGLGIVGIDLELPIVPSSKIFLDGGHRHASFFS